MLGALISSLVLSLTLTLVLEAGFYLVTQRRNKKDLLLLVLVNTLTNPIVVLSYWLVESFTRWNSLVVLMLLELFAVFVEGYYYKKYGVGFPKPFLFALAANAFSILTGVLIQFLLQGAV